MTASALRIGFIGAGQMATALARGFISAGVVTADGVVACDVSLDAANRFVEQTGGAIAANGREVLSRSNVVFLAVKPQHVSGVLSDLRPAVTPQRGVGAAGPGFALRYGL